MNQIQIKTPLFCSMRLIVCISQYIRSVLFLGVTLTFSCVSPKYGDETERFREYLRVPIGANIPESTNYWIILPGKGCGTCTEEVLRRFIKEYNEYSCLHLLTVNTEIYPTELSDKLTGLDRVHVDSSGRLERLDIGIASAALVITESGRIIEIQAFTPETIDSVWAMIKGCP